MLKVKVGGQQEIREAWWDGPWTEDWYFLVDRPPGVRFQKEPMERKFIVFVTGTVSPVLSLTAGMFQHPRLVKKVDNELHVGQVMGNRLQKTL